MRESSVEARMVTVTWKVKCKMMAGILIVYIRVLISWEITCVIFNLGGTKASVAFFDALDVELGTLSPAQGHSCMRRRLAHKRI